MKKIVIIVTVLLFLLIVSPASAGWSGRDGHSSVAMPDGSIILMGGSGARFSYLNDVWRSIDDGVTWEQQTAHAEWSKRDAHSSVVMPDGSIILMGGSDGILKTSVWRSTDNGVTWKQQTARAEWSFRSDHSSVAMPDGSIILMGGQTGSPSINDVWRSTDNGVTWKQQTASAEWSKRHDHSSVAMPDGSIILMGGYDDSNRLNDVWRSTDNGVTWKQQTASAGWSGREGHSSVAMPDGSIILMGGYDGSNRLNDVWRSTDNGVIWTEQILNPVQFPVRGDFNSASPTTSDLNLFLPIGLILAISGLFAGVYFMMVRIKREKTLKEVQEYKHQEAESFISKAKYLASRGRFLDAIKSVDQALALQPDNDELQHVRAQYVTDEARRPDLHISLDTTPLRAGSWQQISATLTNPGSADALGIKIALSDDFEVRRVDTCTVEAGGSTTIEIPLLPKHGGHVPLDITLTYEDPWSRVYSTSEEFWIDVNDMTSFTHVSRDTPVSPVSGFSPQPLTPKQFPTELVDRYRDISFIGKGGFARVFRATRPDNTEVAVKIPLSIDAATGKSFIAELQSWTRLSHPNIVKLYDYNIMPMPYFEMEYCESALADMEKPMAPREAAGIIFNICEGVKVAHNQRIIHRDLKPQNILIKNGVPKVSDWGLSKVVTESRTSTTTSFTAYYAAPEQINNTGKDERADIWQIGVIFYELVTGVLPFTGESMVGVVSAITMKNPQPPSKIVAESSDVESIILKCLEKEPDNRFQSILELQKELARYLEWNYSQELRNSISSGNGIQAAYYCGELVMTALHTGDAPSAYKYLSDLLIYTKGDLQVNTRSLADNVQFMVENDIEVSADIIRKADLLIHQIRSRR
ncbi:protein kinase domain-containing protein [Methanoculleus sp. UBA303]|uniref:protein kinase domain-containing protein n=1 Tax=Methanoculleus sp. UBA303 TaxID=1915497 RepID=UPI0025EC54B7|nr:protein kinase [Methanoculleus sp. UBA303]